MIAEIKIDHEQKIIIRTLVGAIVPKQVLSLIREIAESVKHHKGYNILVDIRDTTFQPAMGDLLEIATECSQQLISFGSKIAFLIPDTEQRRHVAKLFRTCMEAQGFVFMQFFNGDDATAWLND